MDENKRKKKHRVLPFLLVIAAVAAVVVFAAYRDGTGLDVLRRHFSYGGSQESGAVRFTYDPSAKNRCAAVGDGLAVLSGTEFRVLDGRGQEVYSVPVAMENPALVSGGGRAAAYDVGGTELYVADLTGEVVHLTADPAEPYISVTLNEKGWMAVTAKQKGYKGGVTVYNDQMKETFVFHSSERFVTEACVDGSCRELAAVTLGQDDSVFVSSILFYPLDSEEPRGVWEVRDGLVVSVTGRGGQFAALSDTCLAFSGKDGDGPVYSFAGQYLREYDLGGEDFSVLLLNRYQSGSVGRLVTVDDEGQEIASLSVSEQVLGVSAAGRYAAVLYSDKLVLYNRELQEYASLTGTDYARGVLMRSDGSALLLASDSARIFLP
ncbi:DUF5711 family protein [Dysosmobacter sp.]|uniref:DUF5711 family protein n=1 Tax=Dysosmobacter sp. TaxID=2591382 RepID=UPI002A86BBED|nr:DUF5711 family protein [Dysosmobacter sp.]MDY3282612.1 DUF5711 family protein [Dysosmobacter sp.]